MTTGFWYLTDANIDADVGQVIRNAIRGPPWLIVDHSLQRVLVTAWPGRLLRVHMIDTATDDDGAGGLVADAGYTRCVAIEVVERLDPTPCLVSTALKLRRSSQRHSN
jgi:hypothetical protein